MPLQAGGAAHSDGDGRIRPLSRRIASEGEGGDIRRFAVDSESLEGDGCRFVARLVGGGDGKGAFELWIDAEGGRRRSRPAVRKSVGKFPDTAKRILGGERDCDCLPEKQAERDRVEKLEKPVGSVACPDAGRGLRIQVIIDRDRLGDGAVRLLQIQGRGLVFSGRGKGEGIRPGRAVKGQTGIAVGRGENDGSPVPGRRIFPHRELRPGTEDEILQARGSGADGEKGAFLTCQRVVVRSEPVPIRQREAAGIDGIAAWRFAAFSGERPGEGRRFPGYRSPIGITQFRVRLAGEFFLIRQRDDGQAGPADQQLGLSIVRIPAVLFGAEIDGVSAGIPVGGRGVP